MDLWGPLVGIVEALLEVAFAQALKLKDLAIRRPLHLQRMRGKNQSPAATRPIHSCQKCNAADSFPLEAFCLMKQSANTNNATEEIKKYA